MPKIHRCRRSASSLLPQVFPLPILPRQGEGQKVWFSCRRNQKSPQEGLSPVHLLQVAFPSQIVWVAPFLTQPFRLGPVDEVAMKFNRRLRRQDEVQVEARQAEDRHSYR